MDIDKINEAKTFLVENGFDVYSEQEAHKIVQKVLMLVLIVGAGSFITGFIVGMVG